MRKFNVRWWLLLPKFPEPLGLHSHYPGIYVEGLCAECLMGVPTIPIVTEYDAHQFMWGKFWAYHDELVATESCRVTA